VGPGSPSAPSSPGAPYNDFNNFSIQHTTIAHLISLLTICSNSTWKPLWSLEGRRVLVTQIIGRNYKLTGAPVRPLSP